MVNVLKLSLYRIQCSEMALASKNIVTELNEGEKLNGDNYEILSMKIQYVLEEQELLKTLNLSMNKLEI